MLTITADDGDQAAEYARRLLDAAADLGVDAAQVATNTRSGGVVGFTVPDNVAEAAGFPADAPEGDPAADLDADPADTPPPGTDQAGAAAEAPARNASRDVWAAWLDAQDPPVTYDADAKRDELVAVWDAHNAPAPAPVDAQ